MLYLGVEISVIDSVLIIGYSNRVREVLCTAQYINWLRGGHGQVHHLNLKIEQYMNDKKNTLMIKIKIMIIIILIYKSLTKTMLHFPSAK